MALSGISIDLCDQAAILPGVRTLEYAPLDVVDAAAWETVRSTAYNQQAAVTFTGSGAWLTMPVLIDSGSWTEDLADSPQGDYYNISISATLPADSPAVRAEINGMKQRRYLLRITDRNGAKHIVGTPDMPLRFDSKYQSGNQPGDSRGYRITFQGAALHASPGYTPIF